MKEALKLRLGGAAIEDIAVKLELPKETVLRCWKDSESDRRSTASARQAHPKKSAELFAPRFS